MLRQLAKNPRAIRWWIAAGFVVLAMLFGGGARPDVLSVIWLRPVAIVAGAYAIYTLRSADLRSHRFLCAMAAAIICLTALHLLPLPPSIWHALPGRDVVREIDAATGIGEIWRPLSLVPTGTWNALFSLSVPLTALFFFISMDKFELARMLRVFILMIALSAGAGLVQATSGSLSLYDITNPNAGLFANRNHQGVVLACLFPMLAVFAWEPGQDSGAHKIRLVSSVALGLAIIPLLLVTGARAGIAAAVLAIASVPLVAPVDWRRSLSRRTVAVVGGGLAAIGLLVWIATLTGRNFVLLRFQELDATEDQRFSAWEVSWHLVEKYFPFGSGFGSFEQVFQIDEPTSMLSPRYWNHAHNDWLELALVGGLPAVLLLALAVAGYGAAVVRAFRRGKPRGLTRSLTRLGCVILTILGLASVFDYPIRTPAAACLFVFAAVLAAKGVDMSHRPANEGL